MAHAANSTSEKSTREAKFPLSFHKPTGYFYKTIKGHRHYFGRDKAKALEQWHKQKDDLLAGHRPRDENEIVTVAYICNYCLTKKRQRVERAFILLGVNAGLGNTDIARNYFEALKPHCFDFIVLDALYRFMPSDKSENENSDRVNNSFVRLPRFGKMETSTMSSRSRKRKARARARQLAAMTPAVAEPPPETESGSGELLAGPSHIKSDLRMFSSYVGCGSYTPEKLRAMMERIGDIVTGSENERTAVAAYRGAISQGKLALDIEKNPKSQNESPTHTCTRASRVRSCIRFATKLNAFPRANSGRISLVVCSI